MHVPNHYEYSNGTEDHPEQVVISGISGRYPESSNIEEFKQNLFNGTDIVTDDESRWPKGLHGLPSRTGKIRDLSHFDATFFGINSKAAHTMDPQLRILLEATFEALVDAGINPDEVRGSNTGVFIAVAETESSKYWTADADKIDGYGMIGTTRAMFPNRISFTFDFKGPSYAIDCACSSSGVAFVKGFKAIMTGECDAAIVGGCTLCIQPTTSLELYKLSLLNAEGICRSFDADGNGYVRSDTVGVIYLQRAKSARRVYATILGAQICNDGYKKEGITFPSGTAHKTLFESVCKDAGINPNEVFYIEAHAAGTNVGDPQEVNAVVDVFCKSRKTPLLIGSVKTNMGHSEHAAAFAGLSKVIISMESGMIPANLHFRTPNPDIPGLFDGRLKVVTKNEPWDGGIVGINSLGFGGTNVHTLLRSNLKKKPKWQKDLIPRLVTVSGRTEEAVEYLMEKIRTHKDDKEFLALIHTIYSTNITGHLYRGYQILGDWILCETVPIGREERPIWFVYSGMGSQWNLMAKELMRLDVFRKSIKLSADILLLHGIDLETILLDTDESVFDIINSFVAITAVQIALTDVLKSIGIQPDGIVGHSVGEIGCGYADEVLTVEQTLLSAYYRGRATVDSNLKPGAMAAVGLSWEECLKRCPPEVITACHNSSDNVTVSGPPKAIEEFVHQLKAENIFAKHVNCCGYAFHSKHIADAGPNLLNSLNAIIPKPKPRTSRWVSSSIPEERWNEPVARMGSAEYYTNNLLSPVRFYEAIQHIPDNAITIEVAPHGLLQAVLNRALGPNCLNFSLMKRNHSDTLQFFLSNIGMIYNAGGQPTVGQLYEPISFPVGRGTPSIGTLIKWDHSIEWTVPDFSRRQSTSYETIFSIDVSNEDYQYLTGYIIDGRILFPFTGYMCLAWKTFAKIKTREVENTPVVIEDFEVHRLTILTKDADVKLSISVMEGSGYFEISEGGFLVATGRISKPSNIEQEFMKSETTVTNNQNGLLPLTSHDVYKELRLRGYEYGGLFQGIAECDNHCCFGKLKWCDNWVSFLDAMLQFTIIGCTSRELYLPSRLKRIVIDPQLHLQTIKALPEGHHIPVYVSNEYGLLRSGGVEASRLEATLELRHRNQSNPVNESYTFTPLFNSVSAGVAESRKKALTVAVDLIVENHKDIREYKVVEVGGENCLALEIKDIIERGLELTVNYTVVQFSQGDVEELQSSGINVVVKSPMQAYEQNVHFAVLHDAIGNFNILQNAVDSLLPGGFILLEERNDTELDEKCIQKLGLEIVASQVATIACKIYLVLRRPVTLNTKSIIISITDNFAWVEAIKDAIKRSETDGGTKIFLVSQGQLTGLLGLLTSLRQEASGSNIAAYYLQDPNAESFSLSSQFYLNQIKKDLVVNILSPDGEWGTFRYLALSNNRTLLQSQHAFVCSLNPGDMSSLKWVEHPPYYRSSIGYTKCTVHYSTLTSQDVSVASGNMPQTKKHGFGIEFSGYNSAGKRVMGITKRGSIATACLAYPELLWEVPDTWSLAEAATVPVVYALSYYVMVVRRNLQPGNSVLIVDGSSGIGRACISIALHMGCRVYTTTNNFTDQKQITTAFPQLDTKLIRQSIDNSTIDFIMNQTEQQGIDVILYSGQTNHLQVLERCLAFDGRLINMGSSSYILGVLQKQKNNNLIEALLTNPDSIKIQIANCLCEGIVNNVVKPLPALIFDINEIEAAFKVFPQANATKVLIKVCNTETCDNISQVEVTPMLFMNPGKSYIIVGGLGGFGLELANWLVTKGATKLILTSRTGVRTGFQSYYIRRWREQGVYVEVSTDDAALITGARLLLSKAAKVAPIGGIFNVAVHLKDALIENQTEEMFQTVAESKINITKNLDDLSNEFAADLDHFVVFSSLTSGYGNVGQTNYGYANSVMERICEERTLKGLPALAIQWGAIGDVGTLIEDTADNDKPIRGSMPQRMYSCLANLEKLLLQKCPIVSSFVLAEKRKEAERSNESGITETVKKILGLKSTFNVPQATAMADLGMDSFMGTEVKLILKRCYNITLSAQEIRGLTFKRLVELTNETPIVTVNGN